MALFPISVKNDKSECIKIINPQIKLLFAVKKVEIDKTELQMTKISGKLANIGQKEYKTLQSDELKKKKKISVKKERETRKQLKLLS